MPAQRSQPRGHGCPGHAGRLPGGHPAGRLQCFRGLGTKSLDCSWRGWRWPPRPARAGLLGTVSLSLVLRHLPAQPPGLPDPLQRHLRSRAESVMPQSTASLQALPQRL